MIQRSQLPLILVTAFLDILGMSLFIPLLPGIISAFGMSASWTGYSQAIYAIGVFLGGMTFGKLSDIYGRKRLLSYTSLINFLGYAILLVSIWNISIESSVSALAGESGTIGFSSLGEAFQGMSPIFLLFLLARLIGGLGGAGYGVTGAYVADISSPTERV